jgi:signal transduction histidine kinase/ActR/RegA family two-component response regulator
MRLPATTMIVPPKVPLSRPERFLETACRACRACWGGLVTLASDGVVRDHITSGLADFEEAFVRDASAWTRCLQELAIRPPHRCGKPVSGIAVPHLPRIHSSIGLSWPAQGNSRAVLYVVRTEGEPFGRAEEATLQALSQLLVQESQQDESHLIAKLRVLNRVAQGAANVHNLPEFFSLALGELERQIPLNCGAIWLCDEGESAGLAESGPASQLQLASSSEQGEQFCLAKGMRVGVSESMLQPCVAESAATYADRRELAASPCALAQSLARGGASASFATPLRAGQRVLGVLQSVCHRPGGFTNEQIQLLYLVADLLGPAIGHALYLQRLLHANEELRATHDHLIQSEKIRALGEMASGMAHDFNNALCGVLGFLELALQDPHLPLGCRDYLESSKTCAIDAAETVRRVQDFARRERTQNERQVLDLDEFVRHAVELCRPKWESLQQLDTPIAADVETAARCQVRVHPSELREALTNLIFNAVDAMPRGGRLSIRTKSASGDALISVQDTGVGISEDAKRRLFEPFFTTKGERGNGLGLSVAFGIIQRHGGAISVDSKLGQGATFTIRLPIDRGEPAQRAGDTEPDLAYAPLASSVLVVEDEESVRRFLSVGLEQLGYQAQTAPSAEAALDAMSARHFDVVLTDLGLPGMSGADLAKTVQQRAPGTPVVLLTGWGEQIQAENQHIEGVTDILAKPVTIKALARTLAKTLTSACAV